MRTMTRYLRLPLILLGGGLLLLALKVYVPKVKTVALDLYTLASSIYAAVAGPINNVRLGLSVPAIGAFLLGLMAATAPCQLSTNAQDGLASTMLSTPKEVRRAVTVVSPACPTSSSGSRFQWQPRGFTNPSAWRS